MALLILEYAGSAADRHLYVAVGQSDNAAEQFTLALDQIMIWKENMRRLIKRFLPAWHLGDRWRRNIVFDWRTGQREDAVFRLMFYDLAD
jgi:hypothetical protein